MPAPLFRSMLPGAPTAAATVWEASSALPLTRLRTSSQRCRAHCAQSATRRWWQWTDDIWSLWCVPVRLVVLITSSAAHRQRGGPTIVVVGVDHTVQACRTTGCSKGNSGGAAQARQYSSKAPAFAASSWNRLMAVVSDHKMGPYLPAPSGTSSASTLQPRTPPPPLVSPQCHRRVYERLNFSDAPPFSPRPQLPLRVSPLFHIIGGRCPPPPPRYCSPTAHEHSGLAQTRLALRERQGKAIVTAGHCNIDDNGTLPLVGI